PVASANPATAPLGSEVGLSLTVYAVPEVPSDRTATPGRSPRPSAAAMLSPVPQATLAPFHFPTTSTGPATRGTAFDQSRTLSTTDRTSHLYSPDAGDQ